ncbi:MAG: hypothetical protein GH155_07760 [Spirochaeta sp.]|nr:hypothetical protein [Spirochaeta sp.]
MVGSGITDTHAHLADSLFDGDRAEVVRRAQTAGVTEIIGMSTTIEDAQKNLRLAQEFSLLKPAAGLYPGYPDLDQAEAMATFIRSNRSRLAAIGEVGLDYWLAKEDRERELQLQIFNIFVDLALELDLPLNVHSRSAGRHIISFLLQKGAARVQLHAFDGKASSAQPAVEAGFFFSIPPSLVRSRQKQKLVRRLPVSCLLVESDSPVLGPTPEARNEPGNIPDKISFTHCSQGYCRVERNLARRADRGIGGKHP